MEGFAGDKDCDGCVAWTTSDDDYSNAPTIRWGRLGLFVGVDDGWGGKISVLDVEEIETPEYPTLPELSVSDRIDRKSFIAVCVQLAALVEAPNLNWVREAAGELFDAIGGKW